MAETDFLAAVEQYLQTAINAATLQMVGVAEPESAGQLPAVVLSLESTERAGNGLGERTTLITDSALRWTVTIDLANPVLLDDPTFRLLDDARTNLILPHGGQVRQDGTPGPLGPADLIVNVAGTNLTVLATAPTAGQVTIDPVVGKLTFGAPIPPTGIVTATYFLGQWEQRVVRFKGVLRIDVCAADSASAASIADAVVAAMLAPGARNAIPRLLRIELTGLGSIGTTEQPAGLRRRSTRFTFDFESDDNRPDSSGGVIARIPITIKLDTGAGLVTLPGDS